MSSKQRIIAALLLAASLSVSCGGSGAPSETTAPSGETTAPTETTADPLGEPELPAKTYGGYEFKILTQIEGWGIYNNEHLVVEEETGEILNDAIYKRNGMVEDKFDVSLAEIVTKDAKGDLTKSVMAGDDSYDLVIPTWYAMLGTEYCVDFFTLDHVQLDKPWWNQNYAEAMSVNEKLTSAVSSLMLTHMDSVMAMLYNKNIAADNKLPDLYQIVRDGDWTLGKLFELSKNVTLDLDGNGEYDDSDRYTFVGLDGILRLSSGVPLNGLVKDGDDFIKNNLGDEVLVETLTKLRDIAAQYERDIYNPRTDKNNGGDGDKAVFRLFKNDQTLFYVHGLGAVQQFRDMKSDFGVLPTPKLDENQESYAIAPDSTKSIIIPTSAGDLERTAIILEYMSWAGYTYLRPQYYDAMLQSKYLRDEESVEMMDEYIYTSIGFKPIYQQDSLSSTIYKTFVDILTGTSEVASTIASKSAQVDEELAKYLELYE